MRWLLICLVISLGALLLAAAGVARHIWLRHRELNAKTNGMSGTLPGKTAKIIEEIDVEP